MPQQPQHREGTESRKSQSLGVPVSLPYGSGSGHSLIKGPTEK